MTVINEKQRYVHYGIGNKRYCRMKNDRWQYQLFSVIIKTK